MAKTKHVAVLDEDGFFRGVTEVPAKADGIEVPADCDLEPGRYRWDGASFVPVRPLRSASIQDSPAADAALRGLIEGCRKAGVILPPQTLAWARWFDKTMEG